jgi:hypothetical protein
VVTQLKAFLSKPHENVRVVYIRGLMGRPDSAAHAAVFVRVNAGRVRVIGLGQAKKID